MQLSEAVATFLVGYFSTCKRSAKTLSAYRVDLGQLENFVGAGRQVSEIVPETLEEWAVDLKSDQYAAVSIRRKFATARVFFTYWVRKGLIDKSPLWRIRLDLGRERVLPRSLAPGDAKQLMEQVWRDGEPGATSLPTRGDACFLRLRNIALLEVLFATGMRVGELVKISLQDWCDDEQTFVVKGKGSRQRLALLPDERSLRAMQTYLSHRRTMDLGHDALFVNFAGNQISTQGVTRVLANTAKQAGVSQRVTPHMIRHTVATLLLRYGADIRIVQEVLGHASIVTTQRYTHISKEHLFSALRSRHPNYHLGISLSSEPS